MSRDPPQRRSAARETAVPLTARRPLVFTGVQGAQATARQGGASGTEAASLPLTLRHGMETRCPEGAGQRQRSWLCAKHDSPPGRPESAHTTEWRSAIRTRNTRETKKESRRKQVYYHSPSAAQPEQEKRSHR